MAPEVQHHGVQDVAPARMDAIDLLVGVLLCASKDSEVVEYALIGSWTPTVSREIAPDDMLGDIKCTVIVITNHHAFKRRETLDDVPPRGRTIRVFKRPGTGGISLVVANLRLAAVHSAMAPEPMPAATSLSLDQVTF